MLIPFAPEEAYQAAKEDFRQAHAIATKAAEAEFQRVFGLEIARLWAARIDAGQLP